MFSMAVGSKFAGAAVSCVVIFCSSGIAATFVFVSACVQLPPAEKLPQADSIGIIAASTVKAKSRILLAVFINKFTLLPVKLEDSVNDCLCGNIGAAVFKPLDFLNTGEEGYLDQR